MSDAPGWLESLRRRLADLGALALRSGLPINITNGGIYPTNYLTSALAVLQPGATMPENGVGYNQNGNPASSGLPPRL